jgi:LysM repeat protein
MTDPDRPTKLLYYAPPRPDARPADEEELAEVPAAAERLAETEQPAEVSALAELWEDLKAAGWHEGLWRYTSHALALTVLVGAIWASRLDLRVFEPILAKVALGPVVLASAPEETAAAFSVPLTVAAPVAALAVATQADPAQISRLADIHTLIPTRGRAEVITYTVVAGDTLFGIAEKYGLKPETVLWGNYFTLKDDPHALFPGQVLNILPVDGTYHYVTEGNTLDKIAKFYGVEPQALLDWAGNHLDPQNPTLTANTWLVIPGGQRESQAWSVPTIRREERIRAYNFGQCPGGYSGAVGSGSFVWPANNHFLSGYDFSAIHHGIDIKAGSGAPIYGVDAGVVVYAGPNDYGYGNLVMIDHGNGWQSVYAHLSQWNVVCGQSVSQGEVIGLAGNTGRSSGAHLHFELRYEGAYVNPWSVLP